MQVVILCGGKGTRLEGFDLPKPLCMIRGKSILYHVLEALPKDIKKVSIFYSEALDKVQFKKTVIHTCPMIDIDYIKIDVETRGPAETGYIGIFKAHLSLTEPILFIDNDTINEFSLMKIQKDYLGLGVYKTDDSSKPYSFVKLAEDGSVNEIKEKEGISLTYCTGLYYFPMAATYIKLCDNLFETLSKKKEYYMSDLYARALVLGQKVFPFSCSNTIALGTKNDIVENIDRVKNHPMRICFDIDNTLITYSDVVGSQDGIVAIPEMIELIKKLHAEGNTIVLQTARSMKTCDSNIGKANKRGVMNVLKKLEEFDVPYDEIYFGKPWADLYIDDRAWNQYTNPTFSKFFFSHNVNTLPIHLPKNCSNNENKLFRKNNVLIKEGPTSSLEGEIYFYEKILTTEYKSLFPDYIRSKNVYFDKKSIIEMSYIEGVTVSRLFRNRLLTRSTLQNIFESLTRVHAATIHEDSSISKKDLLDNYIVKLEERIKNHPNYTLPNIHAVLETIKAQLLPYIDSLIEFPVVHGDPWFDNMMITDKQEIKFLDMKGKLGSTLTVKGDKMADYAKIYQSILGFDYYLNDEDYDPIYEANCREWFSRLLPFPIDDRIFEAVTACCIIKTFYYFSNSTPILPIYRSLRKMQLFSTLIA